MPTVKAKVFIILVNLKVIGIPKIQGLPLIQSFINFNDYLLSSNLSYTENIYFKCLFTFSFAKKTWPKEDSK